MKIFLYLVRKFIEFTKKAKVFVKAEIYGIIVIQNYLAMVLFFRAIIV